MNLLKWFRRRRFSVCGLSDVGLVRKENQDAYFIDRAHTLFCVADGMGGGEGGAAASSMVASHIAGAAAESTLEESARAIKAALEAANRSIREYAARHGFSSMATTAAVLAMDPRGGPSAVVANVGDSRVYRRRRRKLERLSVDHRAGRLSNFLTRAIGGDEEVVADWRRIEISPGDVYLVCSDGVSDMLGDSTINAVMALGGDASHIASRLSDAVRRAGARDNYTLVVVKCL